MAIFFSQGQNSPADPVPSINSFLSLWYRQLIIILYIF